MTEEFDHGCDEIERELIEEMKELETDDWVQYTYETYGAESPEYQAARIKSPNGD